MSSSTKSVQGVSGASRKSRQGSQPKTPSNRPTTPLPLASSQTLIDRYFKAGLEFMAQGVEVLNKLRDRLGPGSSKAKQMINSSLDLFKLSIQEFGSYLEKITNLPANVSKDLEEKRLILEEYRLELEDMKRKNKELSFLLAQKQRDSRDKHQNSSFQNSNNGRRADLQRGEHQLLTGTMQMDMFGTQQQEAEEEGELNWRGVEEQATFGPRSHEVLLGSQQKSHSSQIIKPAFQSSGKNGSKQKIKTGGSDEIAMMFGLTGSQDDMTFGRKGRDREQKEILSKGIPEELMRSLTQLNPGLALSLTNPDESFLDRHNHSQLSGNHLAEGRLYENPSLQNQSRLEKGKKGSTGKRTPQRALALSGFEVSDGLPKSYTNSAGKVITPSNGKIPFYSGMSSGTRSIEAISEDHPHIRGLKEDVTKLDDKLQELFKQICEEVQELQ